MRYKRQAVHWRHTLELWRIYCPWILSLTASYTLRNDSCSCCHDSLQKTKLLAVTERTLWNGESKQSFFPSFLHSGIWPLWWTGSNKHIVRTLRLHLLMFAVYLKKKGNNFLLTVLFSMEIIPNSGLWSILASRDSDVVKCLRNLWNHSCKHLNIKWRGKSPLFLVSPYLMLRPLHNEANVRSGKWQHYCLG